MIIGLSGYAQSGKDTVAKYLVENHGFTRVAFADPIRTLLYTLNPLISGNSRLSDLVDEYGWEVSKQTPEVRRLLQELGVGARKVFGEGFWVHQAMKTMLDEPRLDLKYVITDVRFFNEADMVRANGGQIWRVERTGVEAVNSHVSEHDIDNWDFDAYLHNNSTLEDLEFAVKVRLMASI